MAGKKSKLPSVKQVQVMKNRSVSDLLKDMARTGFQGKSLAKCAETLEAMIKDRKITILVGYAGSLSTTGQYEIINWMIENGYVDILVATGANLSEDIVDALGRPYVQGSHRVDDRKLFEEGYNRYYDVYGNESDYLYMTEFIAEYMLELQENQPYSSREFLYGFGQWMNKKGVRSIVSVAAKHGVPVFCPAIIDSPYGDAALIAKSKGFNLVLDGVKDYVEFMRLSEQVKGTGVLYIGGGVPKDFIQLFAVTAGLLYEGFKIPNRTSPLMRESTPENYFPHEYAVQITTDSPQWGGLSGCTFDEAVSWGKEDPKGQFVQCYCEATIALPILSQALAERLKGKRKRRPWKGIF
jgi:deoxyhypusine synthase